MSADEDYVATISANTLKINTIEDGQEKCSVTINKNLLAVAFVGDKVCVSLADKTVRYVSEKTLMAAVASRIFFVWTLFPMASSPDP